MYRNRGVYSSAKGRHNRGVLQSHDSWHLDISFFVLCDLVFRLSEDLCTDLMWQHELETNENEVSEYPGFCFSKLQNLETSLRSKNIQL